MADLGLFMAIRIQEVQREETLAKVGRSGGRATRGLLVGRLEELVFGRKRRRQEPGGFRQRPRGELRK